MSDSSFVKNPKPCPVLNRNKINSIYLYCMPKSFFILFLCFLSTILAAQPAVRELPAVMPDSVLLPKLNRLARLYKLDSAALAKYDKIITFDREVYVGKIHNVSFSEVRFTYPHEEKLTAINRSLISQILYTDGRRDVFIALDDRTVRQKELVDTTRIIIKSQKDWMKVKVTEDPADVVKLKPFGNLKASYEADMGNMSNDDLMRQAGIILKKRAALLKAHYVLVETKFFHKSYGDLPKVDVTARAFGY